jgi:hypothetical protein
MLSLPIIFSLPPIFIEMGKNDFPRLQVQAEVAKLAEERSSPEKCRAAAQPHMCK